jgi:lysophospholipase L1-like esterase
MSNICIFGDSTAWGAWDLEKGGWVNRLWLKAANLEQDNEVYNLSISGGTTETVLARLENESKIRGADVIVIQTGGNDASFDFDTKKPLVDPDKFAANLEEIIRRSKKIGVKIIFVGFENCDESKTMPVSWCNLCYSNESIKKYNEIMKTVCDKFGMSFIETFGLLDNTDLADGLHPNASGHQKIFTAVEPIILND